MPVTQDPVQQDDTHVTAGPFLTTICNMFSRYSHLTPR